MWVHKWYFIKFKALFVFFFSLERWSFHQIILSFISMYPILMLFESCVLCSFLGCIVSLVVFVLRENGFHRGTISIVLIYIYLVYSKYQFSPMDANWVSVMTSDGNCHLYSIDCPTLGNSFPFPSSSPIFIFIPIILSLSQLLIKCFFRFLANLPLVQQPLSSWTFAL